MKSIVKSAERDSDDGRAKNFPKANRKKENPEGKKVFDCKDDANEIQKEKKYSPPCIKTHARFAFFGVFGGVGGEEVGGGV